jgi:DNA polymerase-3 subunit gamma/tau
LKTLEEPPAHVKFMFATTEPEKVLTTILSRCQRFDLKRIPITLIAKHLGYISKNEKIEVEEAALQAIARGADGCMRDAESTLDQLISFCGDKIVENDVLSMFGLSSRLQIQNLAQAILDKDMALALQELHALANNGKDLSRLVSDLLGHFRNLMLWKVTKGNSAVLELSEFETQVLVRQEALIQLEALARILEVLVFCESRLRDTLSKGILIEVSLLEAIQARDSISIDSVLKQLQQFRTEGVSSVQPTAPIARPAAAAPVKRPEPAPAPVATPAPAPAVVPKPAAPVVSAPAKPAMTPPPEAVAVKPAPAIEKPAATAPTAPAAPTLVLSATEPTAPAAAPIKGDLSDIWAALLKVVGVQSRFVLSYLGRATPISFDNNILSLEFPADAETEMNMVDNSKNRELIQAALREMGFGETKLKYRMQSASEAASQPAPVAAAPAARTAPAPRATPAAKPASAILPKEAPVPEPPAQPLLTQEELKNDPLIQKALELFKAQLVDMN